MPRRNIVIVLCLVLALSTAAVPANAGEDSGTVTLYWLETHVIEMNPESGMKMEARWDIRVTDGSPVNVYFLSLGQYLEYTASPHDGFDYLELNSKLNTTSFSKTTDLMDGEPSYLVIECAGFSAMDSSTVAYEVEWDEQGEDWYEWCIPGFIGIAAVAGVAIFAWWRMRGGRSADGHPPDGTHPPGTG